MDLCYKLPTGVINYLFIDGVLLFSLKKVAESDYLSNLAFKLFI